MNSKHFILLFAVIAFLPLFSFSENFDSGYQNVLSKILPPPIPSKTTNIHSLGAKPDSVTDCKPVFDAALKMAATTKGGLRIIIPRGTYLINGPLHLVSNVCLDFEEGARLKFSGVPSHFLPAVKTSWEGTFVYNYSPMIYAYGVRNVIIRGKGIIDGNAANTFSLWRANQKRAQQQTREQNHTFVPVAQRIYGEGDFLRPQLIQFYNCKNILIEDVHITNSPFWCVHLLQSENITVRGISFNAKNINNDGIDPEYSRNILIENVQFDNGDDNIAIKAGRDHEGRAMKRPTENIIIRNCRFKGLHAVVIGSEMSAGVRNVFIENNSFAGYCKRGIYLKSNPDRGGFIKNIYVRNLELDEVEDLFYITSFYHGEGSGFATDIRNISIENVKCNTARNAGIVIQGFPQKKVTDVLFKGIDIKNAKIGVSVNNVRNVRMEDVNIGGKVLETPTFAH